MSVLLFADRERTEIKRAAALHLYRLLQRYNWCLSNATLHRARWRAFWGGVSEIERIVLSHFLRATCAGHVGVRVHALYPPADFELFECDPRPCGLTDAVEAEFLRVVDGFYRRMLSPDAARSSWQYRCPHDYAFLEIHGLADAMLAPTTSWVTGALIARICVALIDAGEQRGIAESVAATLAKALRDEIAMRERRLCGQ